ncbi:HAD family phosphatase, partial [Candidatus Bipolaricaulota bacterium]|nr:HAD family phosphatase [Candidatus Bipolaricaulota bacterium]
LGKIKAIHFDLDGSLVNSRKAWFLSEVELLRGYGVDMPVSKIRDITHDDLVGRGQKYAAKFYKNKFDLQASPEKIREKRIKLVKKHYGKAPLIDGAEKFLRAVNESSLKITLATSAPLELVEVFLEKHGFRDCFSSVTSDDHVEKSKPSPDIFVTASRNVGVNPEESLVVEDSKNGLLAAKRAGALCLLIPNEGFSKDETGILERADFIAKSLASIDIHKVRKCLGKSG